MTGIAISVNPQAFALATESSGDGEKQTSLDVFLKKISRNSKNSEDLLWISESGKVANS